MRRSDHSDHAPSFEDFGSQLDDSADLTEQFWGQAPTWQTRDHTGEIARPRRTSRSSDDTTGAIRAIRDGIDAFRPQRRDPRDPTGEVRRTRAHGAVRSTSTASQAVAAEVQREATLGELAAGWGDEPIPARPRRSHVQQRTDESPRSATRRPTSAPDHDTTTALVPLAPRVSERLGLGSVDPLLARLGAMILVGVLLVPVALSLRPSDEATVQTSLTPVPSAGQAPQVGATTQQTPVPLESATQPVESVGVDAQAATSTGSASGQSAPAASPTEQSSQNQVAAAPTSESSGTTDQSAAPGAVTQSETSSGAGAGAATVDATAERVVPECPQQYTAGPGDSWYRIAEGAGISPNELLNENRATLDTVIFPGDEICLPKGATVPSTPTTTVAPATTEAPATTVAPSTTAAPTTTEAPPTSMPVIVSTDEVQRLIREIWPADQHEKALQVAWRESRYRADADNNFCCYGVFQIYFTVHRSWLDDFGVNTATDLFDARKNITAAYELYQRAGGWGPWGG